MKVNEAKTLLLAVIVAGVFAILGTAAFSRVNQQASKAKRAIL